MTQASSPRYCITFVCQKGELEIKALLLAASLRQRIGEDVELIAAVPGPVSRWGEISSVTRHLLAKLAVRVESIESPLDPDYPIGNKLACFLVPSDAQIRIFLDSDILCLRSFDLSVFFTENAIVVKNADLATFGKDTAEWRAAYACNQLAFPDNRVLSTVSGETMLPYFNAGVIGIPAKSSFAKTWIEVARVIDGNPGVINKRPWLDQIALPIAAVKSGLNFAVLDETYNFPAHLKPLASGPLPAFCHYHSADVVRHEPVLTTLVIELANAHPELRALIQTDSVWRAVLKPDDMGDSQGDSEGRSRPSTLGRHGTTSAAPRDLLLTGIPRSGTSFTCKLIHGLADCVVINEPVEVFPALQSSGIPWGIPLHYRGLRKKIRDGEPIENKLRNGEFIEDTAIVDARELYAPRPSTPDFVLGTKNTLAYLARLPQLSRAMPHAMIIACVRHPLDTIASWKSTFPHLKDANLEAQVVGHSRDAELTARQRQRLVEISTQQNRAIRRALLWRHLAETLLESRRLVTLIRYEDLVANPAIALAGLTESFALAWPSDYYSGGVKVLPETKRNLLDATDYEAIKGICTTSAVELGYHLPWR